MTRRARYPVWASSRGTAFAENEAAAAPAAGELCRLNRLAARVHWKSALAESGTLAGTNERAWFENRRKGYFYVMLGLPAESRVLDVGAGSGIVSDVAAGYFREVVALEPDAELVRFMDRRFRQDRRTNVTLVRGDGNRLPFRDASFDLIVVHGVLEWLPGEGDADPVEVQRAFLRRCHELLSPGGRIALAIENRWHFNFLLGRGPHGDPPLTTVAPRRLADRISRWRRGRRYATPIHSWRGLSRLLAEAGFSSPEVHAALPSYYDPIVVLPLGQRRVAHEVLGSWGNRPRGPLRRLVFAALSRSGVLPYFLHSFFATGVRP